MTKKRKKSIQDKLNALDGNEQAKLYKRARQIRKQSLQYSKSARRRSNSGGFERMKSHSKSLDDYVTELLEQELPNTTERKSLDLAGTAGQVVRIQSGNCELQLEDGRRIEATLSADLALGQQSDLAIGDQVLASLDSTPARVSTVLPRKSVLSRPDPHLGTIVERVLASNIDVVVIVVAAKSPPLRPRLIDRTLIAIEHGGAQPLICINKIDQLQSSAEHEQLEQRIEPYLQLGINVVRCSALHRQGTSALMDALEDQLCVFIGHSGVGKSSLVNALAPELDLEVGAINDTIKRGCHTTTGSYLYDLGGGVRLIDTPGVRNFGLEQISTEQLQRYFHDFDEFLTQCRFADCSHSHEPRCGIRDAVERGKISQHRYQSYLSLVLDEE